MDDHYLAVLTEGERLLREALLKLASQLPAAAQQTTAWKQLDALMKKLGMQGPETEDGLQGSEGQA